mgnify:CR=1 FL=1
MVSEDGVGVVDLVSVCAEDWAIKSPSLSSVGKVIEEPPSFRLGEMELVNSCCVRVIDGGLEGEAVESPSLTD